jgi:hypothetical protein
LRIDMVNSVPAGTTAVSAMLIAVEPSGAGYLSVFPCNGSRPNTSAVNYTAGKVVANNTIVGVDGGMCVFSSAATNVVVDLTGTFSEGEGAVWLPSTPTRVLDTRSSGAELPVASSVEYAIPTPPTGVAVGAYANVTSVAPGHSGYLTTYACGGELPNASTVNYAAGEVIANGATVSVGSGTSCAYTCHGGHIVIDLTGWWVAVI